MTFPPPPLSSSACVMCRTDRRSRKSCLSGAHSRRRVRLLLICTRVHAPPRDTPLPLPAPSQTPVYVASEKGHNDTLQTLIAAGGDVNKASVSAECRVGPGLCVFCVCVRVCVCVCVCVLCVHVFVTAVTYAAHHT